MIAIFSILDTNNDPFIYHVEALNYVNESYRVNVGV